MTSTLPITATEDGIALSGKIVSPAEAAADQAERVMIEMAVRVAKMSGQQLHPVKWDNGFVALIPGDPRDTEEWTRRVVETYRQIAAGAMGEIDFGA